MFDYLTIKEESFNDNIYRMLLYREHDNRTFYASYGLRDLKPGQNPKELLVAYVKEQGLDSGAKNG